MGKEEIMDKYWVAYLRYWQKEVRDVSDPPTEDGFWAWYAFRILDQDHNTNTYPEVQQNEG